MDEPILRVSGLGRTFNTSAGPLRALAEVSFDAMAGETLGIVGESGCGKSTLARLIVGIDRPSTGEVLVGGMSVAETSRAGRLRLARLCQMVFQDPYQSLNPRLRVGALVAEPLVVHRVHTRAWRTREVARLLGLVGLPRDAHRCFPHELSGGQRQRVGIARALALKPRLLVADEPVSALDVSVQAQILNLLADLKTELGLTLLLVSHDLSVVEHMADRVLVMYLGEVVEIGGPAVFQTPVHPYTEALLAAAPTVLGPEEPVPPLSGEVPSALSPPPGCAFHPRCPRAVEYCGRVAPALVAVAAEHHVRCHAAEELAR